ncbi:GNAT family N-acetyltransferase [Rhizobium sp. VS19-DR104.2]|uniref:GNAT family N-acetyltransferase n=1 Tax=unclassified Rhizobium TaxID=2613769 RepID=UPI001CC5B38B|nr:MULTISPECIES: GNAT family N-acetyltransferase [unclassified Rhizobium]MBZ5760284.1 GNAT family N-acetyltransferase [Rhizobium sp. VS19-DR96]MBZ5766872.1 GNAT family N-acetyltransferase [Rhizobium sp. VS19-DR129.2]MBZ5773135.1 GNAT family N-acetyltransferase [Rhizobium sp. VS19-DRK62.2]MBZ5784119.1 GNAT family N-acetyltransferase [Rhizobium sp. VS19-DR121]MBZ5802479.1 GNAT family N-acetyltransferase [Rhizobium sp. VS19-DR181]
MAKAFHAVSGLPFQFSAANADALFRASLIDEDRLCLVFAPEAIAHGVLVAHAAAHPFAPIKVASELMWWVDPEHRGLAATKMLNAYEAWARGRRCQFAGMVGLGADPSTSRLYDRRGYAPVERHFMKSL